MAELSGDWRASFARHQNFEGYIRQFIHQIVRRKAINDVRQMGPTIVSLWETPETAVITCIVRLKQSFHLILPLYRDHEIDTSSLVWESARFNVAKDTSLSLLVSCYVTRATSVWVYGYGSHKKDNIEIRTIDPLHNRQIQ